MITVSNYKTIEFLSELFAKAKQDFENAKSIYFSEMYDLKYFKVANEWASRFNDLGFFETIDDVLHYLERPEKWQNELYLIKCFDLTIVYKQDYREWLKDIDCPEGCEGDVIDVMTYILHNNYSIHWITDLLDELKEDFDF